MIKLRGNGRYDDRELTFGIDDSILKDYDRYVKFVTGCEHAVRKDDRYTKFIAHMHESGLDKCAILGNIDGVSLEMHHGPIFNLFDYCDIVTKACLLRGNNGLDELTTFDVGDLVLTEHELGNIMVVFMSKVAHKGGHINIFIDIKATVGRIDRFIARWGDGMEKEHYRYISRYIDACRAAEGKTNDAGLFDTAEKLKSFK